MKKVLICPLNWGLGHATRCIPIAREFHRQGFSVDFASDGGPLELLRLEFPRARFHELPGYAITYPTNHLLINVGRRMMSLLIAIREEHRIVSQIVRDEGYEVLVSDNRYGCYSPDAYNIYITHQINIVTPGSVLDPAVNAYNHRHIRKYHQCWVPDYKEPPGLSGQLAHGHTLNGIRYIGPVSRMEKMDLPLKYKMTAVISGPEPQRTNFEVLLREQLAALPFSTALVGGDIRPDQLPRNKDQMVHFPFLTTDKLNELMARSEIIICRGGYTTLMDLAALGKKAVCIPTPGQTEQEYLTGLHDQNGRFLCQKQDHMNLEEALVRVSGYTGIPSSPHSDLLVQAVASVKV